jgi:ribosomal protein L2
MRLAQIKDGDIVQAGGMTAIVVGRDGRRLIVRGICSKSTRHLRADEITAHWRQVRTRARAVDRVA